MLCCVSVVGVYLVFIVFPIKHFVSGAQSVDSLASCLFQFVFLDVALCHLLSKCCHIK